jgi:Holliday junction DNA helicase RuvA
LLILSSLSLLDIRDALVHKNESVFLQISGIGKKLATRIVNELKNIHILENSKSDNISSLQTDPQNKNKHDAISALMNLGIPRHSATTMVDSALQHSPNATLQDIIKVALQNK